MQIKKRLSSLIKRLAFLYGALSLSMFLFGFIVTVRAGIA